MTLYKNLSVKEKDALLKYPVYICLLAANDDSKLDDVEKKEAIKFTHIKSYTSGPLLAEFYSDADKVFEINIEQINKKLPKEKSLKKTAIKNELLLIEKIVRKLGKEYTAKMHYSMQAFKTHVSKAHRNVLVDFIFPMPLEGITD